MPVTDVVTQLIKPLWLMGAVARDIFADPGSVLYGF